MTVEQFKSWFDGFTDALQLDLVNGFDSSDLEDVFNKIKEKLAEIEVPSAAPNQFPLGEGVPPSTPNQFPLPHGPSRYPNSSSVPGYTPNIYFTNSKGVTTEVDRLAPTWSQSSTWTYDPNELAPKRG